MIDIIDRIKVLAGRRGMSLRSLSKAAGIHPTTLYAARYKGSELKVSTLERICEVLEISLAEFFDFDGARGHVSDASDGIGEYGETGENEC